jgi:hypothetical protein
MVVMDAEIGVNVQESTTRRLMKSPAIKDGSAEFGMPVSLHSQETNCSEFSAGHQFSDSWWKQLALAQPFLIFIGMLLAADQTVEW